jgi:hypothetical protein
MQHSGGYTEHKHVTVTQHTVHEGLNKIKHMFPCTVTSALLTGTINSTSVYITINPTTKKDCHGSVGNTPTACEGHPEDSNLGQLTAYSDDQFHMISVKCHQVNAAYYIELGHSYFLHILSNFLVIGHPKIQH